MEWVSGSYCSKVCCMYCQVTKRRDKFYNLCMHMGGKRIEVVKEFITSIKFTLAACMVSEHLGKWRMHARRKEHKLKPRPQGIV